MTCHAIPDRIIYLYFCEVSPTIEWLWCGVWDPGGNFFPGLMDEVMIFHSALEQEDIQELMDKGYQNYLAVDPEGKLGTTWGHIKATHHIR